MKYLIVVLSIFFLASPADAQPIPSCKAETLMTRVSSKDTLYIINFWATWCGPCVKELPEFNELHKMYAGKPVKVLMVSLDFPEAFPDKLVSFIRKKKLLPEVVWLDESLPNEFIPKIENAWQGSIPATLIIYSKNQYRNFFEGTVTAKQISMLVDRQLAL